jgi:hypothetical protein
MVLQQLALAGSAVVLGPALAGAWFYKGLTLGSAVILGPALAGSVVLLGPALAGAWFYNSLHLLAVRLY